MKKKLLWIAMITNKEIRNIILLKNHQIYKLLFDDISPTNIMSIQTQLSRLSALKDNSNKIDIININIKNKIRTR